MAIRPADTFADIPEVAGRRARWWAATKDFVRKRPLGAIGAAIVLLNIIVALGANVFAAYDPLATDYGAMLARPSMAHWLGTDAFGRDVLSRIIFGSRRRLSPPPHQPPAHAAQRDGALPDHAHGLPGPSHPAGGVAVLPRPWRRGADAGVGTDAPRRRRAVRRAGALDGDLPRPRHQ